MEQETTATNENIASGRLPILLNVDQALKELGGMSKSLLYELINSRELESVTIRRRRFIPSASVLAYVQRRLSEEFA